MKSKSLSKPNPLNTPSFSQLTIERSEKLFTLNSFTQQHNKRISTKGSSSKKNPNFSFGNLKGIERPDLDSMDELIKEAKFEEGFCLRCDSIVDLEVETVQKMKENVKFWLVFGVLFFPALPVACGVYCCSAKRVIHKYFCGVCGEKIDL